MGLDDHIWLKITTHLPLRDFAALAATCRWDSLLSKWLWLLLSMPLRSKLTTGATPQGCMEATSGKGRAFCCVCRCTCQCHAA